MKIHTIGIIFIVCIKLFRWCKAMKKCRSCIRMYEYKTAYPCRYCTENKERHTYFGMQKDIEVKSYYQEAKCSEDDNDKIPY